MEFFSLKIQDAFLAKHELIQNVWMIREFLNILSLTLDLGLYPS